MECRNMEVIKDTIIKNLQKYKEETNCKGVVIGISGGKDSTVVAMLAKLVWGNNVIGIMLPNGYQSDLCAAQYVVRSLNLQHMQINIDSIVEEINNKVFSFSKAAKTNIPPRVRMTMLYAMAQTMGYRVMGTGNLSEIYIGWTTKWGDGAYDINPIGHLTCTEVVELGKLLIKEFDLDVSFITKTPEDGLTGISDEDNFGFTYKELDDYILNGNYPSQKVKNKIDAMHKASEHKRLACGNILSIY